MGCAFYTAPEVQFVEHQCPRTCYGTAIDASSLGVAIYVCWCVAAPFDDDWAPSCTPSYFAFVCEECDWSSALGGKLRALCESLTQWDMQRRVTIEGFASQLSDFLDMVQEFESGQIAGQHD